MQERVFQKKVISALKNSFRDCLVLKTDSSYIQGCPDLLVLYKNKWAALEVKNSISASYQPNQKYYIDLMNSMSYAAVIHPDNIWDIMMDLNIFFA